MSYKFTENISKLSQSKNVELALVEWDLVDNEKNISDGHCICGTRMKNAYYFINANTGHCIQVGIACMKKFRLSKEPNALKKLVDNWFNNFEAVTYIDIDDLFGYSINNLQKIVANIKVKINRTSNIDELNEYKLVIMSMINKYNKSQIFVDALNILLGEITDRVHGIEFANLKEREERERHLQIQREQEIKDLSRFKAAQLEDERIRKIRAEEIKALVNERKKNEIIDAEERKNLAIELAKMSEELEKVKNARGGVCKCNIPFSELCSCENPDIILNTMCLNCKASACRCTKRK